MKKIDKLILSSFLGPFFLTFLVVVFILLTQHMLKYFDDIVGKDLGVDVLAQLFFYFAIFMTPIAIPLAVLLSSLMTFGNLGEHFELTAIKSAGISLLRALLPIFVFVLALTVLAFYSNNYFVPKAALEAYSLLYDIKQKKPALDLKEGTFYNGIPEFSIKVNKKHADGQTIEDVIIYDHRNQSGNKNVTLADSGAMYTIHNDRYLKLELFNGHSYAEGSAASKATSSNKAGKNDTFRRAKFSRSEFVLDLSSFDLDRTDKDLFKGNRIMRNLRQLKGDVDSVRRDIMEKKLQVYADVPYAFYFHLREDSVLMPENLRRFKVYNDSIRAEEERIKREKADRQDSINRASYSEKYNKKGAEGKPQETTDIKEKREYEEQKKAEEAENKAKRKAANENNKQQKAPAKASKLRPESNITGEIKDGKAIREQKPQIIPKEGELAKADSVKTTGDVVEELMADNEKLDRVLQSSLNMVRQGKSKLQTSNTRIERLNYEKNVFEIQWHKILANSLACIIMFLIGAPLGAIIKRGGLGVPVLVSIIFFIIFYVISMTGEKWAKQDMIDPMVGIWAANAILLPVGLIFLRQARNDARLFDSDFYNVMADRFKSWFGKRKKRTEDSN
ncbi:membrane protein, putative [Fulvivirga imtechensis AK7]|uniref:Membrane protein, putative n=1 Tax=Fulvivirga imtechensis AK7 TaxID=1237149 RepID=L8JWG4_9BACT|nr:LptF/LptG family permease [Fulvivirga imtechensis]ELR73381.1 membrane protein, putative [Fulvivirga imtechensis AK7]